MSKKHIFLSIFSKITIFACVFCVFFISPVFATLPAGYTELEYIESTGTQYIVTNINDVTNCEIGMSAQQTSLLSGFHTMLGVIEADGGYKVPFSYGSSNHFYSQTNVSRYVIGSIQDIDKHNFRYVANSDNISLFIDDTEYIGAYTPASATDRSLYIFARMNANGTIGNYTTQKVWNVWQKKNGVYVVSLIPAKRNSDGEIGMYDTVSGIFFTNQGTGDFIAGPIAHCKTFGTNGVTCTECETDYILNNVGGCSEKIKIATTKMVDDEFAATEAKLAATVQTIESVVSRTISQTGQIQVLQNTKQTRPDESCPANMKCLLVQDEDGTPHWYLIIEP